MNSITFREWLFNQEIMGFLKLLVLREAWDAAMKGASDQNNMQFNQLFGVQKNWFGIILGLAVKRVKGEEAFDVAQKAATDMLMSMHQKTDKFYTGMAPLIQAQDENQIVAFFTNAAALRVRRYADRRAKSFRDVHMSAITGDDSRGNQMHEPIDNQRPEDGSEESQMEFLKNAVQMELERMSQTAKDPRSQKRLALAKQVAAKRLENPPNFPSMDELLQMFPDIGKTSMFAILQDIQDAFYRVAQSQGMDGVAGAIEKKRNKTAG